MIAMVSRSSYLPRTCSSRVRAVQPIWRTLLLCAAILLPGSEAAFAQAGTPGAQPEEPAREGSSLSAAGWFIAGAVVAFGAHEAGHASLDVVFDADPYLKRVDYHGIPFFAIAHRRVLSPRREQAVSSAGFWVQHATSEWVLTREPDLRSKRAPLRKGMLAFNVLSSVAYAGTAFARTGPAERDTRGIAQAARIDERWVGAIVLTPAVLDAWRYFDPDARWAVWASRGAKIAMLMLMAR